MTVTEISMATRKEWIGLAVLALPCVLYSMDLTVLNLAVPSLSAELRPSAAELLWIVDIYGFLVAGSLITMGTLGDRIGRRKLLMVGATVFGIASVLAAFATSSAMLIATRAMMGVAAATLAPSTLSLIRNMFHDAHERTIAISIWIMSYSAGAAIGPVVGGLLLENYWWGSVFLINVPVMLLLLAIGPVLLPEFRDEKAGRIDILSAAESLVAVLAVIYGLKRLAEGGSAGIAILSVAAGVTIGIAFLRRQARLADPLIDLRLFRIPSFSAALAVNLFGFLTAFATFLFIAQYLQSVLGMSPLRAGLWGLPCSACVHRRVDRDTRDRAAICAIARDRGRNVRVRCGLRHPLAGRRSLVHARDARPWADRLLPRADACRRADHGHHPGIGAAGASGRGFCAIRDERRARRRARHRTDGQYRHRRLPRRIQWGHCQGDTRRCARGGAHDDRGSGHRRWRVAEGARLRPYRNVAPGLR